MNGSPFSRERNHWTGGTYALFVLLRKIKRIVIRKKISKIPYLYNLSPRTRLQIGVLGGQTHLFQSDAYRTIITDAATSLLSHADTVLKQITNIHNNTTYVHFLALIIISKINILPRLIGYSILKENSRLVSEKTPNCMYKHFQNVFSLSSSSFFWTCLLGTCKR